MQRIAVLVSSMLIAVVGCRETSTEAGVVAGLRITSTADRARIHPGDTVWVRVVARNVSPDAIHIDDERVRCALGLEIRGPGPVNYYRGASLCTESGASAVVPIVLAPGDSLVGRAPWPGVTYVSSSGAVLGTEGPAPLGTYVAIPSVWLGLRARVDGAGASIVVAAR